MARNSKGYQTGKGKPNPPIFYRTGNEYYLVARTSQDPACPVPPEAGGAKVWPFYKSYFVYVVKNDGTDLLPFEPGAPRSYNAESATCKDGSAIFTSDRGGSLNLYVGKINYFGTIESVKRITDSLGYNGRAAFSADCKKIVWQAFRPVGKQEKEFRDLLKKHLVKPSTMEIWTADVDGSNARQVTHLDALSTSPHFTPRGLQIIFSSNLRAPRSEKFELYLMNLDGTGLERVSFSDGTDGFASFSPEGDKIVFTSSRNTQAQQEMNLFVADWIK